jgi:protein-disulfide isomerase
MTGARVNFGAAVFAAMVAAGCRPASSNPPQTDTAAAPQGVRALNAPDPLVVAADRGRTAGDSTARTWVVIASDFQCPFCRQWHEETYRALIDEYVRTGKIRVAYLNYPLNQHRNAVPTANAAMCAGAQNRFWQYHDALFQTQERWAPMPDARAVLDSIARAVGVDVAAWSQCYESQRMLPLIFADRDRASAGGVRSTPTFLIGDQALAGTQTLDEMRPVIDAALARSGSGTAR